MLKPFLMSKKRTKPPLIVVAGTDLVPAEMPTDLGKAGSALWQTITNEYEVADAGGREVLRQACAAKDTIADCVEQIAREGMTLRTAQGFRAHPLIKVEQASRAFLVRCLHRLGLDLEPVRPGPGRPAKGW
jgi:P27 family predicted phage terminase small subunit